MLAEGLYFVYRLLQHALKEFFMKNNNIVRTIAEVGIFAAIGFVLDEIQGIAFASVFTAGGSIGFAMVAVLIIAYRRGWLPAICTGLIMGLLDLITKSYLITFWQVLLDYILPYALVGFAGLFKPLFDKSETSKRKILWLCIGAVVGGMLKFLSHFIVGMLVWAPMGYSWAIENEALYSFAYNIAFTGPSIVLSAIVLVVLFKRAPKVVCVPQEVKEFKPQKHLKAFDYVINPLMVTIGTFLFIFFLVVYILNFKFVDKGWAHKMSSDQDAVALMFTGILLMLIFINCTIATIRNKQNNRLTSLFLIILSASHIIYAIAKILICYLDDWVDPTKYFVWMVISFFLTGLSVGLYLLTKQALVEPEPVNE